MALWDGTFEEWEEVCNIEQSYADYEDACREYQTWLDSLSSDIKAKVQVWSEKHPYSDWRKYYNDDGTSKRKKKR